MKKIFLSAGHSNKFGRDRGASGNGYIEGELSVEFRDLLSDSLSKLGIDVTKDGNNTILAESMSFFKKITSSDSILIDIHWNAFNEKSTGTEVLIPDSYSQKEFDIAKDIATEISNILGIPVRGQKGGVKTESESKRSKLGWMRLTGENILIEMCFISNPNDMKSYQKNKQILADKLALVIKKHCTDLKEDEILYTVKKGDSLFSVARDHRVTVEYLRTVNSLRTDMLMIGQKLKI